MDSNEGVPPVTRSISWSSKTCIPNDRGKRTMYIFPPFHDQDRASQQYIRGGGENPSCPGRTSTRARHQGNSPHSLIPRISPPSALGNARTYKIHKSSISPILFTYETFSPPPPHHSPHVANCSKRAAEQNMWLAYARDGYLIVKAARGLVRTWRPAHRLMLCHRNGRR